MNGTKESVRDAIERIISNKVAPRASSQSEPGKEVETVEHVGIHDPNFAAAVLENLEVQKVIYTTEDGALATSILRNKGFKNVPTWYD